jgi:hypothetical protein
MGAIRPFVSGVKKTRKGFYEEETMGDVVITLKRSCARGQAEG